MIKTAIVRKPGVNFSKGITTTGLIPDYEAAIRQHNGYCSALKKCSVDVVCLETDDRYPDCCFVEDTAIITDECAIITHPGDERRQGEEVAIAALLERYRSIEMIVSPGLLDGGDIMKIEKKFFIGLSNRTNRDGADQLTNILAQFGYETVLVPIKDLLHLKTGINYIGNNNIIANKELASLNEFKTYNIIIPKDEELYAANCLLVNNRLLMPDGYPDLYGRLLKLGYDIMKIEMSEFCKMDGGLTCLSLLLS